MHRSRVIPAIIGITVILLAVFALWRPSDQPIASALTKEQLALLDGREIVVYKSPLCGCCSEWEEYLRQYGMNVRSVEVADSTTAKAQGLSPQYWSCHTAFVGDYFVEGHVPVEVIVKLLEEAPPISGITLPGMPSGSPGMDGAKTGPWTIYALQAGEIGQFISY